MLCQTPRSTMSVACKAPQKFPCTIMIMGHLTTPGVTRSSRSAQSFCTYAMVSNSDAPHGRCFRPTEIGVNIFFSFLKHACTDVRFTVRGEPLPDRKSRRKWSEKKFAQTLSLKERENENAGARALLGQLPSFKAAVALIGRLYSRHSSLYGR